MPINLNELDRKKKIIAVAIVLLLGVLLLIGGRPRIGRSMPLYRSAYDSLGIFYLNQNSITVYIRENGEWEPFLAIASRYPGEGNGGVLLLRKYLIQERRSWIARENRRSALMGHGGKDFRYYPMSDIDAWLETEYLKMFSPSIQERILTTNIQVWDGINHAPSGRNMIITVTETVPRRVFLLSENEVGRRERRANRAIEGEPIAYFHPFFGNEFIQFIPILQNRKYARLIATPRYEYTGDRGFNSRDFFGYSWWLRTVAWTEADGTIRAIWQSGLTWYVMHRDATFVRPAFTMPRDTVIERYQVDGRMVYVIHD